MTEFIKKILVAIIIGFQWGDEGKGKISAYLARFFDVGVRFGGGANAGHTFYLEDNTKVVLHLIPCAMAFGRDGIIGNCVAVDPIILREEILRLEKQGIKIVGKLKISHMAPLTVIYHRLFDEAGENEKKKPGDKIGSTGRGIGPTFGDFISREGLTMGDILKPNFEELYGTAEKRWERIKLSYCATGDLSRNEDGWRKVQDLFTDWHSAVKWLRENFANDIINTNDEIRRLIDAGKKLMAEGAQGLMLDPYLGDRPYVTSSITTVDGVFKGMGLGSADVGDVYCVLKWYPTKVGGGHLPTEIKDITLLEELRILGQEFGATTGRPRNLGLPDAVQLRYSIEKTKSFLPPGKKLKLVLVKVDVSSANNDDVQVVTGYDYGDGVFTNKLRMPLKDVKNLKVEKTQCWKIKTGTTDKHSESLAPLYNFLNLLDNELQDLRDFYEWHYISTGPGINDGFYV